MTDILSRLNQALEGRYRIERLLGEGGMATVYLADDLRHHRKVAIKVLHPELSAVIGADRFLTEIRTTANLQHPHILPLFDSGEADGLLFYVMPYVEGETLRELLDREKQLPVEDAVTLTRKIAGALQSAHERGIVHRDIKPANILLQRGEPLLADFGIALAVQEAGGQRLTETGLSIGTPYYMSPEQAMADRDPDARSDIYSLACVLYELLAGDPPFTASTAQGVVAKILSGVPAPVGESRPSVPEQVEATLDRALQRIPADRFRSMAEFADALAGRMEVAPSARGAGASAAGHRPGPGRLVWAAALVAALAVAGWGWFGRPSPPVPSPSHLAIPAPNLGGVANAGLRQIAISPDGRTILFSGAETEGSDNRTHRRDLADIESVALSSTSPFLGSWVFSPDGREFVGLTRAGGVLRYAVDGSNEQALGPVLASPWMDWSRDGHIWFSDDSGRGLQRLGPDGAPERILEERIRGYTLQQILEDQNAALMVAASRGTSSGPLVQVDLDSGDEHVVMASPVVAGHVTSGYLVTVLEDGTLQAARYDSRLGQISGAQIRLAEGVLVDQGIAQTAVSDNGTLVYIPDEPRELVYVDRLGAVRPAARESQNYHSPVFSPDGRRLAVDFSSVSGRSVWILDVGEGVPTRATFAPNGHDARWTPDGERLTYLADGGGTEVRTGIWMSRPGSVEADSLIAGADVSFTGEWLPDGSALVSTGDGLTSGSGSDITLIRNAGRGPVEPLVATRFEEMWPAVSPDGRWLAYGSNRSGSFEIYVRPLGSEGPDLQVSLDNGTEPRWNPRGDRLELFHRSGGGAGDRLVSVVLQTEPALNVVERTDLFSVRDVPTGIPHTNYDVSPDGETFAMVKFNWATRIMVIQNLPELVAALASAPR